MKCFTLIESLSKSETAIIIDFEWSVLVRAEVSFKRNEGSFIKCWNLTGDLVGVDSESPNGLKMPAGGRLVFGWSSTMVASTTLVPRTLKRDELNDDSVTSKGRVESSLELVVVVVYDVSVLLKTYD